MLKNEKDINEALKYAKMYYKKGYSHYKLQKYEKACENYEQAIKINPFHADALKQMGWPLYRLGKFEKQLEIALKAIKINQSDEEAWKFKGNALFGLEKYEKALEAYEKSIEISPIYLDAWHNKGIMFYELKKYKKALKMFEEALNLDKYDKMTLSSKGMTFKELKNYTEALKSLEKAIKLDPNYPYALCNKGLVLYNQEKYEDALDMFEKAIKYRPDDIEMVIAKGKTQEKLGKYEQAKKTFENAIQSKKVSGDFTKKKENAFLFVCLGKTYFANGDHQNASENADKALCIDEKNAEALLLKGLLKIEEREYDEAIDYITKANSSKLDDATFFLWSAYAKYIKLESSLCTKAQENNSENPGKSEKRSKYEKHMKEIFEITGDLEKAGKLANKLRENEQKACILYFLGYFYYKCNDIFTAKEKLSDCIGFRTKVRPRAEELLGVIWNRQIKPSWWNWWWSSPIYTKTKRALFSLVLFLIVVFAFHALFPSVIPSFAEILSEEIGISSPFTSENVHIEREI